MKTPTIKALSSACLILLTLLGCQMPGLWGESTPIPSTASFTVIPSLASVPTNTPSPTITSTPQPVIQRVLIVSFDGLRPDAIQFAPMNNLLAVMQKSAYTLNAQTVMPSSTLPAHSSMLTGLCVAKHHVIWNDYIPENGYARGTDLFDIAHASGLRTVMIVGKEKLRQITEPGSTDVFENIEDGENAIVARAIQEVQKGFGLMFIHFPTGDLMGHDYGWLSDQQLSAYREGDAAFGQLLATLDVSSTLIIVTADHGGHETTHGTDTPEDMTIPWIISGPGIQPMQLTTPVQTMDTAATAAYALRLSIPKEWDGIPVTEAFGLPAVARDVVGCP